MGGDKEVFMRRGSAKAGIATLRWCEAVCVGRAGGSQLADSRYCHFAAASQMVGQQLVIPDRIENEPVV